MSAYTPDCITMRFSVVFLAFVALVAAIPQTPKQQAADQDLLRKQRDVITLLDNIVGPIPSESLHNLGLTYDIIGNLQNYVNPNVVRYYAGLVLTDNAQPKHTPFSISISQLRKEVSLLNRVLLGSKDYETFLKTAAWARVHCNEHQFVKAFTSAVLQRPDCQGITLPPPYEVFPHYFFDSRVIQEVQDIKSRGVESPVAGNVVHVPVNYTASFPEQENKLAYFTQDIGLSAYYYYVTLAGYLRPETFETSVPSESGPVTENLHKFGRGARYYYLHQQLLARYNLERLSNGLGPIDTLSLEDEVETPYKPHQRYANGLEFPGRPAVVSLEHYHPRLYRTVRKLEKRVVDAIDSGSVLTPQGVFLSILTPHGLNILGNLIESTGRSVNPRYYGTLAAATKQLLGVAPHVTNIWDYTPSALEIGETAVKDPAFYKLYMRILSLFRQYQEGLPHYQYNDIVLPGVSVQRVTVSPLITFFGDYTVDLDSAVVEPVVEREPTVTVKAQLKRLDHHPYEFQIVVQSDRSVPNAVIRVYLGPKYNHHGQHVDINQDRLSFFELDQFIYDLTEGQNVIVRNSHQASSQSWDWPSVHAITESLEAAVRSQNPFYVTEPQQIFGFPARLCLPKGTKSGFPLQLVVVVSSPDQVPETYNGIVPDQFQNYNEKTFHIVDEDEYRQHVAVPVNTVSPVNTCSPTVAVVPRFEEKTSVPAAKSHYGYLYKQWPGHQSFPRWQQHHYYPGEGEGRHLGQLLGGVHYGQVTVGPYGSQVSGPYMQQGVGVGQPTVGHQQVVGRVEGAPVVGQPIHFTGEHVHMTGHTGGVPQVPVGVGVGEGKHHGHYQSPHVPRYHGQTARVGQDVFGGIRPNVFVPGSDVGGVSGVGGVGVLGGYGVGSGVGSGVGGGIGHGVHHGRGFYPVQHESIPGYKTHDEVLHQHYSSKPVDEVIGNAISLDGKPFGWPLDRPLGPSALYAPNFYVTDVVVHHVDYPYNPVTGQEFYAQ